MPLIIDRPFEFSTSLSFDECERQLRFAYRRKSRSSERTM